MPRAVLLVLLATVACGGSEPKTPATGGETVPANSFKDDSQPASSTSSTASESPKDPTRPFMTKVGDAPGDTKSTTRDGQAECDQMFDRLIELEVASNPQLKGAGPDVVAPPCTTTQKEYDCAMGTSSTAAWKRCVK